MVLREGLSGFIRVVLSEKETILWYISHSHAHKELNELAGCQQDSAKEPMILGGRKVDVIEDFYIFNKIILKCQRVREMAHR